MTEPNAIAICGLVIRAAAATAATTIIPTAARSSSRPESMACPEGSRSSAWRSAINSSPASVALDDPQRRRRVVVILRGHRLPVHGRRGTLGQPPAVAVQRGDERLDQHGVELDAGALAQF